MGFTNYIWAVGS